MIDFTNYKTRKDLESYAISLFTKVAVLQADLEDLKKKLAHAENLLENSNIPAIEKKNVEEEVLTREIGFLDNLSKMGGLDLEQTKQLSLLVNCLVAVKKGEKIEDQAKRSTKIGDKKKLLELVKR